MPLSEKILYTILSALTLLGVVQFIQLFLWEGSFSRGVKAEDRVRVVSLTTWMEVAVLVFGILTLIVVSQP